MTDTIETRRSNLDGRRVRVTQRQWTKEGIRDIVMHGVIVDELWSVQHRCPRGYRVRVESDEPFIGTYIIYANDEEITLL